MGTLMQHFSEKEEGANVARFWGNKFWNKKSLEKKILNFFLTFLSNLSQIWLIPLVNDPNNVSTSQNSHQKKGEKNKKMVMICAQQHKPH
jgi:hypothetical protein